VVTLSTRRISAAMALLSASVFPYLLASPTPAAATAFPGSCPHGAPNHYGSTGCFNDGVWMAGIWGTWHNNYTSVSFSNNFYPYHIDNRMWGYTEGDESRWIEIGLRNGYDGANPCRCVAYEATWSDVDGNLTTNPEIRYMINPSDTPDGSTHSYEVLAQCNGLCPQWDVYYDYNYVGSSQLQHNGNMYDHQVGLETTLLDGAHADNFDNYVEYLDTGLTWRYWPNEYAWVDRGCGSGYSPPTCLNGTSYGLSEWSDSKP
jgi:hypothetical protein